LRGPPRWVFRCSGGEGLGSHSTIGLASAGGGGGESFSSIFVRLTAMTFVFPVETAATGVPLWSRCSPSNCAYIRRNRAGTRIGLPGLGGQGEEGGSIDDVADSVGSADEGDG